MNMADENRGSACVPTYNPLCCENREHIQLWCNIRKLVCEKSDDGKQKFSEILSNTPDSLLRCGCIYKICLKSVMYTANVENFEVLCRRGVDLNMLVYKDGSHKYTVLHKLALHGRSRVFDFLKIAERFGANINLQDAKGKTALHYASCNNICNVLPFARHGARYDIADENGLVPIQYVLGDLKRNYKCERIFSRNITVSLSWVDKHVASFILSHLFRLLAMGSTYQEHGKTLAPLIHLEYYVVTLTVHRLLQVYFKYT